MAKQWYSINAKADDRAEVWIYEQIGEDWYGDGVAAKSFSKDLRAIKASDIDLHLNSPGGSVFEGHAIYNAIKSHPANVTVYIDGLAASIASVIALAGDRIVMAKNALFMIHDPWGFAMGTADEMRKTADVLDKTRDTIVGVYSERTGMDDSDIHAAMSAETWYSADEALAAGFVDEVGGEMKLAACFDLSTAPFKHVPDTLVASAVEPMNEEPTAGQSDDEEDAPGASDAVETVYHPAPII